MAALLARGADIHRKDVAGQTALHLAAVGGGPAVARALIAAGADPRVSDENGYTPVDVARCTAYRFFLRQNAHLATFRPNVVVEQDQS